MVQLNVALIIQYFVEGPEHIPIEDRNMIDFAF